MRKITIKLTFIIALLILISTAYFDFFKDKIDIFSDKITPIISLNSDKVINLNIYDSYTDSGAKAIDNTDGDISAMSDKLMVKAPNISTP